MLCNMTIVNNGEEFSSFNIKFYTAPTHYMISTGDFENVFASADIFYVLRTGKT